MNTHGPVSRRTAGPRRAPARKPGMSDGARRAALDLLIEVREDDAYANLVWPLILDHRQVSGRDAGFATELAYGALRWQGRHDAILAACIDRPMAEVQPTLLDALRLGVHQLHNMRVGPHAAVSETVDLVQRVLNPGAGGFSNAVLRKVSAGGDAGTWVAKLQMAGRIPTMSEDPAGHLSITASHPRWIVEAVHAAWAATSGESDWAATSAILDAQNTPAGVTLVARTIGTDELGARLAAYGVRVTPGRWSPRALGVSSVNPGDIPEVATGAAGVQDEGSQVVALALAGAPIEGPDTRWLDMCAGPGGKAALLAGEVAARGGTLTAVELHEHRASLVRNTLRPIQGRHIVLRADAVRDDIGSGYDRILIDAPCSGLGALRRRPESRWRRTQRDLEDLTKLQARLLRRGLEVVRPGGLVMYVTCSPHLAETDAIVAGALGREVELVELSGPERSCDGKYLRMWPHLHNTDGMFAALLRRK